MTEDGEAINVLMVKPDDEVKLFDDPLALKETLTASKHVSVLEEAMTPKKLARKEILLKPRTLRPQSILSIIHTNRDMLDKIRTRMLVERMERNGTADELDGRTEMAENSFNIRCDSEEEDIVNKRFDRLHNHVCQVARESQDHMEAIELDRDPEN